MIWGRIDLKASSKLKSVSHMHVYIALSSFQGGKGKCNPSLQAISDRMAEHGMYSRSGQPYKIRRISKIISELKMLGIVKSIRPGLGRSNVYQVGAVVKSESGIVLEDNESVEANQSRPQKSESESPTESESYRKEHLKRTPEKNPEPIPQISLEARYWQRKEREREEKRLERENYLKSCEEAQGMILSQLRRMTG